MAEKGAKLDNDDAVASKVIALLGQYPLQALLRDAAIARTRAKKRQTEFWARNYVRAVFAHIEAELFLMRQLILKAHESGQVKLALGDEVSLREESYSIDNKKGTLVLGPPKYLYFIPGVLLTFRCFATVTNNGFKLVKDGSGWASFQKAHEIRNRLTHPKKNSDVNISPKDVETMIRGEDWFLEMTLRCVIAKFTGPLSELRESAEQHFTELPLEEQVVTFDMLTLLTKITKFVELGNVVKE